MQKTKREVRERESANSEGGHAGETEREEGRRTRGPERGEAGGRERHRDP